MNIATASKLRLGVLIALIVAGCAMETPPGASPPRGFAPTPTVAPNSTSIEDHLFKPGDILDRQEALHLTAAQRDAIITDVRTTQTELVEVDAHMRAQRERLVQLLEPTRVDQAEAARVTAELVQSEVRGKTLHLGLLVRIKNRLTPEQQAQLR